jgi:hypothetical protein
MSIGFNLFGLAQLINIPQPAMGLNAFNVPGPHYKMWNTWEISGTEPVDHILDWTATVAKGCADGRLKALVINCHGSPAHLHLGAGIGWTEIPLFAKLNGRVNSIWIVACQVVSFTGPGDGNLFCGAMAKNSGAYVYASNKKQTTGLWPSVPYGAIDGYEGTVWRWNPDGSNVMTSY